MTTGYTTSQVAEILGMPPQQVRAYARSRLLDPKRGPGNEYRYTFPDIILLRTARELREAGVPDARIRRSLERLREQLPGGRPLTAVNISARGDHVVVRDRGTVWEPESGQVHFDFSVSELATRVAPFAREAADARVQLMDAGGGQAPEMTADDWFDLGFDLEAVAPSKAAEAYRRALEAEPGHPEAHVNLGRLLHENGELEQAEAHYRRALSVDAKNATAAFNLGVVLEDAGQTKPAAEAYRRAIKHDPRHAEAHYNLGRIYEAQGKAAPAVRHLAAYRRLTELDEGRG